MASRSIQKQTGMGGEVWDRIYNPVAAAAEDAGPVVRSESMLVYEEVQRVLEEGVLEYIQGAMGAYLRGHRHVL